jgi:transposase InsO family protein
MTNYTAKVERQLSCKVQTITSDNGGEFTSKQWEQHMLQHGIQHVRVPPDAHAQNGRVERVHLTILDDMRPVYFTLDCLQSIGQRLQTIQPIHAVTHRQTTNKHLWMYGQATKQQLIIYIRLGANSSSETIGKLASYNLDTGKDAC